MAVAQERVPQGFQRAAKLQREGRSHRGIASVRVALTSGLARLKEDFADRAVSISADGHREVLATDLKLEAFAGAAVFESLPHGRASKRNPVVHVVARADARHGRLPLARRGAGGAEIILIGAELAAGPIPGPVEQN